MNRWRVIATSQTTGLLSQPSLNQASSQTSNGLIRKASTNSNGNGSANNSWVAAGTVAAVSAATLALKLYEEKDK